MKCAFQITHRDVIWRTHGPKYRISNFYSKCAFRIKIQNTELKFKIRTLPSCENILLAGLSSVVHFLRFLSSFLCVLEGGGVARHGALRVGRQSIQQQVE